MLKSKHLELRRLEESHLHYKVKWVNDPEVNETLLFDFPISQSETKEWYKRNHFNRNRWDFSVFELESECLIGMTGLINLNYRHRHAQLFVTIGEKAFWGKGYAREIVIMILGFAFEELGLEKVYLKTLPNNSKARHIYEKIGFKQEALLRKEYYIHGELNDLFQHSLLKSEWIGILKELR